MSNHSQKGVSLIITFFVMAIIIAMVLSMTTILTNRIKLIGDIGNSIISFYIADSGVEKTLYFDKQKIPPGANRGICSICDSCPTSGGDPATHCNSCTSMPLSTNGCNPESCSNCEIDYSASFDDGAKEQTLSATVTTPSGDVPLISNFYISSEGLYRNVTRNIEFSGEDEYTGPHHLECQDSSCVSAPWAGADTCGPGFPVCS